jgi:hypothetical protein
MVKKTTGSRNCGMPKARLLEESAVDPSLT